MAAARNLGSALIVRGIHASGAKRQTDLAGAVMHLSRALIDAPNDAATLTNLGVAFFYGRQPDRARENLTQAKDSAPHYAAPVCNLGHIARIEHREAEAQGYQRQYQVLQNRLESKPKPHNIATEHVRELVIGDPIPLNWQARRQSTFRLNTTHIG